MTEYHSFVAAAVRRVQVMPSVEVITRLPAVALHDVEETPHATATKRPLPYATDFQALVVVPVLCVHVIPSGEVMTF